MKQVASRPWLHGIMGETDEREYVMYREATLDFVDNRGRRLAEWLEDDGPGIEILWGR